MRTKHYFFVPVLALIVSGCNCGTGTGGNGDGGNHGGDGGNGGNGDSGTNPNQCTPPSSITVSPPSVTQTLALGGTFTQAFTASAGGTDITSQAFFSISDPTMGSFTGNTFTWAGTHGGTATVSAKLCGTIGTAPLTINVPTGVFNNGNDGGLGNQFADAGTSTNASCNPTLLYPPDGVLLPPNTNVIQVHFTLGTPPNTAFEISFTNGITNELIYTTCTGATPADGMPSNGGCIVELSQAEWDYMAQTNRGGNPVTVKVRGMGCDGNNAASSGTRQISFAQEDLIGTLYYWASIRVGGAYNSGGVYRYEFGLRGQNAEAVLTPTSAVNPGQLCIGCHSISKDGRKLVFDYDDNDDDDEYHDIHTDVYDIASATAVLPITYQQSPFPPGYHTWNHETTEFLLSDGFTGGGTRATPPGAFWRVSPAATNLGFAMSGNLRGTTPDWSPDDSLVVFSVPPDVTSTPPAAGYWPALPQGGPTDDLWFAGASLYVAPHNANGSLGTGTAVLTPPSGTNYYYPSFSSEDAALLMFNSATTGTCNPSDTTGASSDCGQNFHNHLARVQVVANGQSNPTPVDLAALNTTGQVTNSWARWSPFKQNYNGGKILWVTFSSTRDYGLTIENGGKVNCFPRESPIQPYFQTAGNCTRTQIWMAAVKIDATAVQGGHDVSWPAFELPFQDLTTNNHLAQWAERRFQGTCTVNSDCLENGCCVQGGCTSCPTTPPSCTATNQCAPGQCCLGFEGSTTPPLTCQPCNGGTGGTQCNSCIDCNGQACINNVCGSCTSSAQCCAPLTCVGGVCTTGPYDGGLQ